MTRGSQFTVCASLALVALLVAVPLWGPGMVNTRGGGDSPFLLQRTHEMLVNLRAGVFPVRWMSDAAYGLGYPFFSYYSALPYYLTGLLALVGLDLLTALKLVQTLGFVAAALAMYGWMHGMTQSRWAAWLAAVAYTVAPFHIVNVYVRGDSLSEFYAFIFYPLILWALDGVSSPQSQARSPSTRSSARWVWPALAYAGLMLTHNISAFIFTPFVLLYLAVLWLRREVGRRSFVICLLSLVVGLLLSAWVWVPTLAEMGFVQTETLTGGYFHHTHHFRTTDLVQNHLFFNYSTLEGDSPFAMGLLQAVFAVLGGLVLVARGLRKRLQARWGFVLLGLLISTLMITPLSKLLWDHLPLLATTQFPWRFLSVQALFAAAATAALVPGQSETSDPRLPVPHARSGWVAFPVAGLVVVSVLFPLRPERLPIGPADVTAERLQLYELFTQNIGTTIGYEWLPQAVVPRPFTSGALFDPGASPQAIPLEGASVESALVERGPTHQVWQVWGEGGGLAFPLLYWPGWSAQVDGHPVAVWSVTGSGYLALEVPPGEHTVLLRLGRTTVRAVAEAVALVAAVAVLVVTVKDYVRRPKPRVSKPKLAVFLSFVVLPLLILLALPQEDFAREDDLTMDFDKMPYLHHNPGGVNFGGVAWLKGYNLSAEELSPGDTLIVTLDWMDVANSAHTATVRLVSPAAVRRDLEPLAEATCNLESGGCGRVVLELPEDISRGVYLLQLYLSGPGEAREPTVSLRALTPGGERCGVLYLRPVWVQRGPSLPRETPVLAPFGPAIRLHAANAIQFDADRLAVRLTWSVARPVASNYGISLRLLDADGEPHVSLDTQPGYGFLPTSLWQPGELITDRYIIDLPEDLAPGESYHLVVVLYQVSTWEAIGQARLGDFALLLESPFEARRPSRSFSLPSLSHPLKVDFGEEIRLAGYDLERGVDALRLTLWWQALQVPQDDYTVFVHLFDLVAEDIVAQSDAMPQEGTYPTSWWAAGEVVSETVTLPLWGVPEGTHRIAVGLYDRTVTRLLVIGPDGQRLADDRVVLPESVEVGP